MPSVGSDKVFRTEADCRKIHEPIRSLKSNVRNVIEVGSKSAQHITFTAIENICRRRIAERVAKK